MNDVELKARILGLLTDIAPDVDADSVQSDVDFRDQFDFDSMDQLHFAIALHQAFEIDIPESEYPRLASIDKCLAFVRARTSTGGTR